MAMDGIQALKTGLREKCDAGRNLTIDSILIAGQLKEKGTRRFSDLHPIRIAF